MTNNVPIPFHSENNHGSNTEIIPGLQNHSSNFENSLHCFITVPRNMVTMFRSGRGSLAEVGLLRVTLHTFQSSPLTAERSCLKLVVFNGTDELQHLERSRSFLSNKPGWIQARFSSLLALSLLYTLLP